MSKLHQSDGRADAATDKGELRKPDDYSDQPGQDDSDHRHDDRHDEVQRAAADAPSTSAPRVGESSREYAHSSGDRNTMRHAHDWHQFSGGVQRDATPGAPLESVERPQGRKRGGGPSDARSGRRD